jgi:hypothetical protein
MVDVVVWRLFLFKVRFHSGSGTPLDGRVDEHDRRSVKIGYVLLSLTTFWGASGIYISLT